MTASSSDDHSALLKALEKIARNLQEEVRNLREEVVGDIVKEMRTLFDAQKSRIDSLRNEYVEGKKVIEEISTAIDGMTNTIDTNIVKSDALCKLVELYYAEGGFAMGKGKELLDELTTYIVETNPGQVISDDDRKYLRKNFPGNLRKMRRPLGRALQVVVGEDFHDQKETDAIEYVDGLAKDEKACKELVLRTMRRVGASTYKEKNAPGDGVHHKPCVHFWVRALMKQASHISKIGLDKMSEGKVGDRKRKDNDEANFFKYVLSPDLWEGTKPTRAVITASTLPGMTAVTQTQYAAARKRRRNWEAKAVKKETKEDDDRCSEDACDDLVDESASPLVRKARAGTKGATPTTPVRNLWTKVTALREQTQKGDPLPGLLARKSDARQRPAAVDEIDFEGQDDNDFSVPEEEDDEIEEKTADPMFLGKLIGSSKLRTTGKQRYVEEAKELKKNKKAVQAKGQSASVGQKRTKRKRDSDTTDGDDDDKPLVRKGATKKNQKAEEEVEDEAEEQDYGTRRQRNREENLGDDDDEVAKPPAKKGRKPGGDGDEDAKPKAKKSRKSGGDGDEDEKLPAKKSRKPSGDGDEDEDEKPLAKKGRKSGGDVNEDEKPPAKKSANSGGDGDEDAKPPARKKPSKARQAEPVIEWTASQSLGSIRPNKWERMEARLKRTDDHLVRRVDGLPECALENDQLASKIAIALFADRHEWTDDGLLLTYQNDRKLLKHDSFVFHIGYRRKEE